MRKVTVSANVTRPAEELFPAAADPERQLQWDRRNLKAVEKLTSGPLGQGSRYRGSFKGLGKVEYEYDEYQPPRRFSHLARMPLGEMRHVWTFEPAAAGTRVTQDGELRPNLLGRILGPVVAAMLRKRFRSNVVEIEAYLASPDTKTEPS